MTSTSEAGPATLDAGCKNGITRHNEGMKRRLRTDGLLPPFALNALAGRAHECVVMEGGTIELEGMSLRFTRPEEQLPVGTQVLVSLFNYFECETPEEVAQAEQERQAQRERDRQVQADRADRLRAEAETFNAQIKLPVAWTVGVKDRLSGLSERSWGDGHDRRTVYHVLLKEPLQRGALKRLAGDFLCTSASGGNGKNWSDQPERQSADSQGVRYWPKVTCKSCLRLAGVSAKA